MLGVFYCSEKGQAIRGIFPWEAPAGCRGSRNEMLSPRKGIPWAWHERGTGSQYPRPDNLIFLYIPQFRTRGLRAFFIRHISISFPNRLQKNTLFLLRAHLGFFRCVFFAFLDAGISRHSGDVRRRSGLETV